MRKVNLDAINEHVSTQYGDLTGVIKIDGNSDVTAIYNLCKDYKFDIKDKLIVGFGLSESTMNGIGQRNEVYCTIMYVDEAKYDDAESKIGTDGILKVHKKTLTIRYSDLNKYIKRYDFLAMTDLVKNVSKIEIIEDNDSI